MNKLTVKIILTFPSDPTSEQILEAEHYLNNTVNNLVYANHGFQIRVHLDGDNLEERLKEKIGFLLSVIKSGEELDVSEYYEARKLIREDTNAAAN